jgi:trk system potassium uptake protein TrkH
MSGLTRWFVAPAMQHGALTRVLAILNIFAAIAFVFGCTLILPIAVSIYLEIGATAAFDEAFVGTMVVSATLFVATRRFRRELHAKDGALLVVTNWILLPAVGAVPLMLSIPGLTFTDAYFEAVSGLTATGSTVLSGLDALPPSVNLWRAQMHWLGGLGIIVLAVAVLPMLGVGGRELMRAEVPGPIKESNLTPRLQETAKGFWIVYAGLTAACVLAYHLFGMSWLDAVTHAFSTMALGGFSSHDASLGYFDSPALELITVVFALAAGVSFTTHFLAFARRSFAPYRHDGEIRYFVGALAASVLLVAAYLRYHGVYPDFGTAFRHALFNTVSVATTLGYASTDYETWPFFAPLWMLFLGSFVTCSGSTGGGIKMMRAIILYKQAFREILHSIHPSATTFTKLGDTVVPGKVIFAVLGFAFLYLVCTVALILALAASGLDPVSSFSAAVACFNNIGPGLGAVGPSETFGVLTDFQTWVCTIAMLLGRLEIFTLLIVVTPMFWRK